MRATGTFSVESFNPVAIDSPIETALPVGIATMVKAYEGAVSGRSATIFTSAFDQARGVGTYVAMESFDGSLDGRAGTFNFTHAASTSGADRADEHFLIVPNSGTGALATISCAGGMAVDSDGTHRVWFDFEL